MATFGLEVASSCKQNSAVASSPLPPSDIRADTTSVTSDTTFETADDDADA